MNKCTRHYTLLGIQVTEVFAWFSLDNFKPHLLTIPLLLIFSGSIAQNSGKVSTPIPEVAEMIKYIEKPVSLYNGQTSVNIPLYTVKDGGIEIPISISYNTSGIKVAEEAGRTGLGWKLNLGGQIVQSYVGMADRDENYTAYADPDSYLGDCEFPPAFLPPLGYSQMSHKPVQEYSLGVWDRYYAPDNYYYNFAEYSGQFYIDYLNGGIHQKKEDPKIWFEQGIIASGDYYYRATTTDGTVFLFKDQKSLSLDYGALIPEQSMTYYLSDVIHNNGDHVSYKYIKEGWAETQLGVSSYYVRDTDPPIQKYEEGRSATQNVYEVVLLDQITTPNLTLGFSYSDRIDISNEQQLDRITISNHAGDEIIIEFSYSYFVSSLEGNYYGKPANESDYFDENLAKNRLKLDGVSITADGESFSYTFDYNDTPLPVKTSYAIDYWGYYNGQINNTNILPRQEYLYLFDDQRVLSSEIDGFFLRMGSCRASSEDFSKAATLEKVTYPTGGETIIEYEANVFDNYEIPSIQDLEDLGVLGSPGNEPVSTLHDDNNPIGAPSYTFEVTEETDYTIDVQAGFGTYSDRAGTASDISGAKVLLKALDTNNDVVLWYPSDAVRTKSFTGILSPGEYSFLVYLPDNLGNQELPAYNLEPGQLTGASISGQLYLDNLDFQEGELISKGAGVRVKRIIQDPKDGSNPLVRHFDYGNGLLMSMPRFYEKQYLEEGKRNPDGCIQIYNGEREFLRSSSHYNTSFGALGALVGYSTIREYQMSSMDYNEDQPGAFSEGYIEYNYHNSISTTHHLAPTLDHPDNGLLSSEIYYDDQSIEVKKIEYDYNNLIKNSFFGIVARNNWDGPNSSASGCMDAIIIHSNYEVWFYPILARQIRKASETVTLEKSFKTVTTYQYTDEGLVSRQTRDPLNPSQKEDIDIFYPNSQSTGIEQDMWNDHYVSPVRKEYSRKDELIKIEKFIYGHGNSYTVNNETIKTFNLGAFQEFPTASADYRETKLDYKLNKLSQWEGGDNIPIAYLWGYNNSYMIAEASNTSPSSIFHTSFEESGVEDVNARTGNKIRTSDYTLGLTDLEPGTYNLIYWKRSGQQWEQQSDVISISNPYYYKTINASTSNPIDEVRFHPVGVQMTTYTYDPLRGVTSQTGPNNKTTYYEYDVLGRLYQVKDQDGNVLKQYEYNYKN